MKALFLNGSPRKNWNTHKMLEAAMKGASEAGAECELVHLYDYSFKGCISCFACKVKGSKTNGLCAVRDDLRPVLEKALEADVIVVGSPVYLSGATAMTRAFIERLIFPAVSYNVDEKTGSYEKVTDMKKRTAIIYTMNCPEYLSEKVNYPEILGQNRNFLVGVFGYSEMLCAYDTYQFTDYSRYEANMFNEKEKAEHRDKVFPEDLRKAYDLGKRLVTMEA